jgi:hypothetical protein
MILKVERERETTVVLPTAFQVSFLLKKQDEEKAFQYIKI